MRRIRSRHLNRKRPKPVRVAPEGSGNLLVLEPETLLRWSLVTYLGKWFQVFPADTAAVAQQIIERHPIQALVVCDDLGDHASDRIESLVRGRYPDVRVIRIVMSLRTAQSLSPLATFIEKPFELAKLAALLGVRSGRAVPVPAKPKSKSHRV